MYLQLLHISSILFSCSRRFWVCHKIWSSQKLIWFKKRTTSYQHEALYLRKKVWCNTAWIWLYQTLLKVNQFLWKRGVLLHQWILCWPHLLNTCKAKCAISEILSHDLAVGSSYAKCLTFPQGLTFLEIFTILNSKNYFTLRMLKMMTTIPPDYKSCVFKALFC